VVTFGNTAVTASAPTGTPTTTSLTVNVSITGAATLGANSVTVTTGAEVVTLANGFTVTAGAPAITNVNPNTGQQGQQGLLVTLTGQFTHWVQGTTAASFGDAISVGSGPLGGFGLVTVLSPTTATAQVNVNLCALAGMRTVTVQSGPEIVTLTGGFSVGATTWSQLNPTGGRPPARLGYTSLYDPTSGRMILFGGGFTSGNPVGVLNDVWVLTNANGMGRTPAWTQLAPAGSLPPARRNHGAAYDAVNNRMIVFGGDTSTTGASIPVTNDVWVLTSANGLGGTPTWIQLAPQGPGPVGRRLAVTSYDPVTNRLTIFGGWPNSLVSLNDVWVLSNANGLGGPPVWTQLNPSGQSPSPRNASFFSFDQINNRLTIFGGESSQNPTPTTTYNDVWVLTNANGMGGTPTWTQLIANGSPGSPTPRAINGSSASPFNAGNDRLILVGGADSSGTVVLNDVWLLLNANGIGGPTTFLNVNQPVPVQVEGPTAYDWTTDRVIQFGWLTSNDTFVLANATNIPVSNPVPALLSVMPNSASAGQMLNVILTGSCTSFSQGSTTSSFGPGIAVGGSQTGTTGPVTATSPTSAVASLNVDPAATVGVRVVNVTTNSEVVTLNSGFTVIAGPPVLSTISPNTGQQGQTESVTITGQNTHFVQGTTVVSFGSGITVNSVTVTNPTSLIANVTIPSNANLGTYTVTVTTGSELVTLAGAFNVTPANQPPVVSAGPSRTLYVSGRIVAGHDVNTLSSSVAGPNEDQFAVNLARWLTAASAGKILAVESAPSDGTRNYAPSVKAALAAANFTVNYISNAAIVSAVTLADLEEYDAVFVGITYPVETTISPSVLTQYVNAGGNVYIYGGVDGIPSGEAAFLNPFLQNFGLAFDTVSYNGLTLVNITSTHPIFNGLTGKTLGSGNGQDIHDLGTNPLASIIQFQGPHGVYAVVNAPTATLTLTGSVTDDGLPTGATLTATWSATSRPGLVSFSNPTMTFTDVAGQANSVVTSATFSLPGTYVVSLTGSDSQLSNSSSATISINPRPPAPSIISVNPNTGQLGQQNLAVAITGQLSNFVQGTSQVSFGTDITVNSVTVGSATSLTANITIPPTANLGVHTVIVTTGAELASLTSGFNVTSASSGPTITSVAPSSGQQGATNIPVTITGSLTHFSASSVVTFGNTAVTASAPTGTPTTTSLTVNVSIVSAAALGATNVIVTTGTEVVTLNNGFTVTALSSGPTLTTVSPNSGQQGQHGPVGIVGFNTHFAQGTSVVSFGPGITVSNLNVTCSTCLTAQLQILPTATPGPVTVTVTTGSEVASLANGFTILPGTPAISSFGPNSGQQGQTLTLTVNGQFTHFGQGTTQVSLGAGITFSSVNISSPTNLTAQVAIDPAATPGTRTLTVTTGMEVVSAPNAFTVQPGTPVLMTLNPGGGQQGQTNLSVAITGQFTHFVQGTSVASFGAGVTVTSLTVTSTTAATAVVNIDPAAAQGARTVTVTTGMEVASFANGFTIAPGMPSIQSVNPNTGQQGQQNLSITVTGQLSHFVQGTTTASFGAGVTITSVTVSSLTTATVVVNIDPAATLGLRNVALTTGTEVAALTGGFAVNSGPFISQINPNTGQQGQQNLSVNVTGAFTHFAQGTTTANFGANVTVASLTISSATTATAVLNIDPAAILGARTVAFTTGTEVATAPNSFIITTGSPVVTQATPNTGRQDQSNLAVTITGQFTNFAQGTSVVSFGGGGVTINNVSVTDPTHLTANISIALAATPGTRTVTVTTGTEVASLANAFSVTPAVNQAPVITIAPTWSDTLPNRLTITYTVTDDGLPLGGALTVSWSIVSTPPGGMAGFQNQTNTSISAGFDTVGTYVLKISATDTQLTTSQNITVNVTGSAVPPPTVSITAPVDGTEVTAPVAVTGSVGSAFLSDWVLEYQPPGDPNFHTLATGTTTVTNGTLGTLDPTVLLNGIAHIRLTATDTSNQSTTTAPISLIVTRNNKIGNFTLSFNDLTVPLAGLPIQIVRTYDSRRRLTSGADFSYGWTLDINAAQVVETVPLSDQWTETSSGGGFPNYCVLATKAHIVTVTLGDGTTYEFTPANFQCQSLVPIQNQQVTVTFTPAGITPPNASLSILGTNQPFVVGSVPGPVTLTQADLITPFDPDQYVLTLPDGRALQLSMQFGFQKMTDLNGNSITVTSGGIIHSSGKGVTFTRNAAKLITQITDPAGNNINYTYNNLTGDLSQVTDQSNQTTTFNYDINHYLQSIKDPRGIEPIKNVYDPITGRLIQHVDAYGNTITYANNIGTSQEVVTDRLNNVTVNNYDADGNIVQVTDALGGVTTRTYDTNDNLKSETNALGKTTSYTYDSNNNRTSETNPLNKTTSYTYNARNQVLTITDPLMHVTINTYDPVTGNLLSTQDPSNLNTSYTYNASGLRTSMTDGLKNVTFFQYDAFGNLMKVTDPLKNVTTYTYDNNGNKTSETKTRTTSSGVQTLMTSYQYDKSNRLIQTTYPDNSTTQIQYNAIGKQSVTIDQLNHQTSYQYDLMGRLTQTNYPDTTTESSTYDAEGDRVTSTDRARNTTTYVYDHLKRLTQTIYADNTSTTTTYDKIGEVIAVQDADGNQTQYGYDNAGRRTSVTDALSRVTTFAYDDAGNQISMTDANNNQTQYAYDKNNRRTQTIYPDTTTDTVAYDALGRTVSKTDQANKTTQFQYDAQGQLTQVTDALLQITSYTYDEVGERISQMDANHHTTTFAYDKLGRRTMRILPLGMSETQVYDNGGNLKTKTDFNGKTTMYNYDSMNRLLNKIPDVSTGEPTVSFTYTFTGQRLSMSDASGVTNYSYDKRDRLTNKATPEGALAYSYDFAGNLLTIQSSNTGGASVTYSYDALNRLSKVTDNRLGSIVTTYSYDKVGNLSAYLYPSGVQTGFTYDTLNRLKNVQIAKGASALATYTYALGPAGNRTAVAELGGRSVSYTYDNLYRLTNETISGGLVNGSIGYIYDAVGNRLSRNSTVTPIPITSYSYDQNDRLTTDTYDSNGNTTASGGNTYTYDFENHLKNENSGTVTIVYDGDGNRVSKTVGGVTTNYLVDDRNLTGYAQVLEEISGGTVQRFYTYGLNRISQSQASGPSFYGYDGHGNARLLTDSTGAISDRYDYDAFGNIISQTASAPNVFLYSGEQNDPNLGFYYLRARYLDPSSGRFWTSDPFEGEANDPQSLTKYTYGRANPVNNVDPSGLFTGSPTIGAPTTGAPLLEVSTTVAVEESLLLPAVLGTLGTAGILAAAKTLAGNSGCPTRSPHLLLDYRMSSVVVGTYILLLVGGPERDPNPNSQFPECHVNVTAISDPRGGLPMGLVLDDNQHVTFDLTSFYMARSRVIAKTWIGNDLSSATTTVSNEVASEFAGATIGGSAINRFLSAYGLLYGSVYPRLIQLQRIVESGP
jgi:RHS repeat-associated protein